MKLIFNLILVYLVIVCLTTTQERHDFIKSAIGDLDDSAVSAGLISDQKLHKIGSKFGFCF